MDDNNDKEGLQNKIQELKNQILSLEKDLIHDSLTGLKTRAFFDEESKIYLNMIQNVNAGKRRQWFGFKNISFLFFDIDHFKKINDTYGHEGGDRVLKKVSQVIQKNLRVGDTAARWGGEEIVASLLGANLNDAKNKAELIRHEIEVTIFEDAPDLKVTVSIGVVSSESSSNFEELLRLADAAMYKSKNGGRNMVTAHST